MKDLVTRFRRLPTRTQQIVLAGSAFLVLAIIGLCWHSHVIHSPEYALQVIDSIETRDDINSRRQYMTDQGAKVILYAMQNQKGPSTAAKLTFQRCQIRGRICFFPFTQGQDAGYLEFQRHDVWQFHDIVMTRHNGREINLSVAYAIDHPILAAIQTADWGAVFENFLKGFLIGLSLGGGG